MAEAGYDEFHGWEAGFVQMQEAVIGEEWLFGWRWGEPADGGLGNKLSIDAGLIHRTNVEVRTSTHRLRLIIISQLQIMFQTRQPMQRVTSGGCQSAAQSLFTIPYSDRHQWAVSGCREVESPARRATER